MTSLDSLSCFVTAELWRHCTFQNSSIAPIFVLKLNVNCLTPARNFVGSRGPGNLSYLIRWMGEPKAFYSVKGPGPQSHWSLAETKTESIFRWSRTTTVAPSCGSKPRYPRILRLLTKLGNSPRTRRICFALPVLQEPKTSHCYCISS